MENKKMYLWKQSKPYLAGLQFALLIAFLATIVSNIITVYGPTRIKEMTNIIASGLETSVDVAAVAAIGGFLAVIYVIGLLSNYLQAFLFTTAIQRFSERLRRAIAEKINRLPLGYFDGHSQGDTLSRVTNDVDTAALGNHVWDELDFSLGDGCVNSYRFCFRVCLYGQIPGLL